MTLGSLERLTYRHLALFGAVVHWYARYEFLMQRIAAKAMDADCSCIVLLTKDLSFDAKRLALLRLLRHRSMPLDQIDAIIGYLKLPMRLRPLCEDVEHSEWMVGSPADAIQPTWLLNPAATVKAVHKCPTTPFEDFREDDEDRVEYTLSDLEQIVESLERNHDSLQNYLQEVGRI